MINRFVIREATADDIPEIVRQRRSMYEDMDYQDADLLTVMSTTSADYLAGALPTGSFRGWLAVRAGKVVGGGAVIVSPWPSHPYDGQCRRATILNVYTYPEHRKQGIGRALMLTMIEWCRREGFPFVSLHASEDGRHLYETLGFKPSNEMRLSLRAPGPPQTP